MVLWGTLILVLVGVVGYSLLRSTAGRNEAPPPRLLRLPSFELQGHLGDSVGLDDLAGEPWIGDFIFTRCPGICPRMTERMAEVRDNLPPDSALRLVSISVDPEHDTPEVLRSYAEKHNAGEGWHFLTGGRDEIYSLCRDGFKLAVELAPEGGDSIEPILHSNRFVLVDGEGWVRGYYDAFENAEIGRLLADFERLR